MSEPGNNQQPPPSRRASFGSTMKAIFWGFFGVRKRRDYEHDSANLNPLYVIVAGLVGALLFIGALILVVKLAVAQ